MENPETESEQNVSATQARQGGQEEQSHTDENSAADNTAETQAEQPDKQESKKNKSADADKPDRIDQSLDTIRERLGIPDPNKAKTVKEKKEEEVKTDPDQQTPSAEAEGEESEDKDQNFPDEIELENGSKLVKVTVDGITVHTTPDKATEVKNGLLRQSDYTKKTQALKADQQHIESEKALLRNQIREFQRFQEETSLEGGFNDPEPLESEYIDAFTDDDDKPVKIREFREAKKAWLDKREDYFNRKSEHTARKKHTEAENIRNTEAFTKEFGEEALEEIYPDLMKIRQALNTTGTTPFPKDMMKIYYRGKNFDKLVEKKIKQERAKLLNQVDKNVQRTSTTNQTGSGGTPKAGDSFDKAKDAIKSRQASW